MPRQEWKRRLYLFWRGWGFSIVVAILIATSFRSVIADWNDVPTGSMKPTIIEGDRIFVNKLAYDLKFPFTKLHLARWDDPHRGDIVVFFSPADGKRLVKRIIGVPGDVIALRDNRLFINGEGIAYEVPDREAVGDIDSYLRRPCFLYSENMPGREHWVMFAPFRTSFSTFPPVTVPEGKYFLMGDNRDYSADSRVFGFVDRKQIVGRATGVVLSKGRSWFDLRWQRLFQKLS